MTRKRDSMSLVRVEMQARYRVVSLIFGYRIIYNQWFMSGDSDSRVVNERNWETDILRWSWWWCIFSNFFLLPSFFHSLLWLSYEVGEEERSSRSSFRTSSCIIQMNHFFPWLVHTAFSVNLFFVSFIYSSCVYTTTKTTMKLFSILWPCLVFAYWLDWLEAALGDCCCEDVVDPPSISGVEMAPVRMRISSFSLKYLINQSNVSFFLWTVMYGFLDKARHITSRNWPMADFLGTFFIQWSRKTCSWNGTASSPSSPVVNHVIV